MSEDNIKAIPYGVTDYEAIRLENLYYVDKTAYLRRVEKAGKYLFFIRPRRFGKSLFLSVMESYFDVYYKDRFDELFKGTWIHENPTDGRGKYLVLVLNFSAVDPDPKHLESSFLYNIRTEVRTFLRKYPDYLDPAVTKEFQQELKGMTSPSEIIFGVTNLCKNSNRELYIIIDEYDNFANTILTTSGSSAYEDLTRGEGFFRAFFNYLKKATTGTGASISRLFITGVSPITLDDVTSGFNIGINISIEPDFNEMLGFTGKEVIQLIEYYRENRMLGYSTSTIMDIMNTWYNNYRFSKKAGTSLFNSDMVLYFIAKCIRTRDLPDDLIDRNVRIDYGKLRHLIMIDSEKGRIPNGNFDRLKQIIEKGEVRSNGIVEGFSVDKITHTKNFLSLLFYLGLLTIKGMEGEELVLRIPNETVRRLYYDYISEAYEDTRTFSMDLYDYERLMHAMAYKGEWEPLFQFIARHMKESMSLRDLITGEKSIQAFLNVYLGLSQLYLIQAEKEFNKGFPDILT
ncbi:MAG: AAA family ATPase, partial [bacterium]|nr:AAA family ATPase [bacterium]